MHALDIASTYSLYDDPALEDLGIADKVGHKRLPDGGVRHLKEDEILHLVKTHELSLPDNCPAIYIVRDGRDAMVSLAHYQQTIEGDTTPFSTRLARLVDGEYNFGSWSGHVESWINDRPTLVVVRYEDLVRDPVKIVLHALKGIGFPVSKMAANKTIPTFDELKSLSPKFFRAGRTGSWSTEMSESLQRQFWRRHRPGMAKTGYATTATNIPPVTLTLPEVSPDELGVSGERFEPVLEGICMPPYMGPTELDDFNFLINLAKLVDPENVFEFGTAEGNTVANLCKNTDASVVTVNALFGDTSGTLRTMDLTKSAIGHVYRENGYAERVTQIFSDSLSLVVEKFTNKGQFDLVIIDACHDYEYVLNDFFIIEPLVSDKGYVLFHDCHPSAVGHLEGAWKACCHLYKAGYDIAHVRGTWWTIWNKGEQTRSVDTETVGMLESIVDHMRHGPNKERQLITSHRNEVSRLTLDYEELIDELNAKLNKVRRIPGYRFAIRLSALLNRPFSFLKKPDSN